MRAVLPPRPSTSAAVISRRPHRLRSLMLAMVLSAASAVGLSAIAPLSAQAATTSFSSTPIASWRTMTGTTPGVGYATLVVGDVVYVGGSFTSAVSPDGATSVARANLAAFSATTGALLTTFRADTDGAVRALAYDGTNLFVGGSYTRVNGVSKARLAALDPATGAVRTAWTANAQSHVYSLSIGGGRLYVGGSFSSIGNVARSRAAAVSLSNGAVAPWAPVSDSTINTLAAAPDGSAVYLGGTFTSINGTNARNFAKIDAAGALARMTWAGVTQPAIDIEVSPDGSRVAMASQANWGGMFNATTGQLVWNRAQWCDGNGQAVHVIGDAFFSGFHEGCNGDVTTRLTSNDLTTGAREPFAPTFDRFWGTWDIAGDSSALVIAGDFTWISNRRVSGFAIFRPEGSVVDSQAPTAPGAVQATATSTQVDLTWGAANDNTAVTGYRVERNGVAVADTVELTYADAAVAAGQTHTYTVRALDAAGNVGPPASPATVTIPDPGTDPNLLRRETFTGDSAGWPAGWTSSTGGGAVADVQGSEGRLGFAAAAGGFARTQLTGVNAVADSDVVFSYRVSSTAPTSYTSVYLRGSGGWTNTYRPRNAYGIQLSSSSTSVEVQRNTNGVFTRLSTVSGVRPANTAKQWVRLRVVGDQLMFRTWADGAAEPSAWAYRGTDTSVTAPGQLHVSLNRTATTAGAQDVLLDDLTYFRVPTP